MKQSDPKKKIKKILQQDNYQIVKGYVYRLYGKVWWVVNIQFNQIALISEKDEIPEMFLWSDVEQVILSMEGEKGNGVIREKTKFKKS